MILDIQSQNGTQSHIFDENCCKGLFFKSKATDIESFWKSIIFSPPKNLIKSLRFFL